MKISVFFLLIAGLAMLAGLVMLQIFLSKRESRWVGLVLPAVAFFFSFLYPLNMAVPSGGVTAGFLVWMVTVWLISNIPAIVFLAIYFGSRGKQWRKKQLDKMNIQDLH